MEALAGDLREEFRISGPDAEEMFILHGHASRNQTLSMVGRELLVEVSIPAQLRQVHSGMRIEAFMAYSLRPSPAPTKAEIGEAGHHQELASLWPGSIWSLRIKYQHLQPKFADKVMEIFDQFGDGSRIRIDAARIIRLKPMSFRPLI